MNKIGITVLFLFVLSGCSGINFNQYSNNTPRLDVFEYFNGATKGWGIVQARKGVLLRQFVVDIVGEVNGEGQLVLTEHFDWSDGENSTRVWVLAKQDAHNVTGTAADVLDSAAGLMYGNVLNWKYQMNLEVDERIWKVSFDDWMFKVSEDMVINRASISKFGFDIGEVTIVFRK